MAVKGTSTVTLTRVVDGTNGTSGTNGVSVTKMDQYYLATTASSGVTTSTSGWTTTFQAITSSKRYLWGYQKYTYSNSTTTTTTPAIIGVYGDTGGAGATGKGVSSVTTYFLVNSSNSGVTTSASGWTTTLQTTSETNRYLWQYEKYQYTDNTSTNTTPRIVSTHGASGKDAITISITPEWSGSTCTLTANVFKGGKQLSDTEILALGCLKWYEGTTFIANGKQLTRTVTSRETLECRLESGGGLMPEFITLADGSLAVKGRNLLTGSKGIVLTGTDYPSTVKLETGKTTVTGAGKWNAYKIDPVPEEWAREITSSKTDLTFGIDIKATGLVTRVPVTFEIRSRDHQNRIVSDTMWIEPEMNGKWHRLSGTVKNVEKRPLALILFRSVTLAAADVGATIEYRKMNLIFGDEPYPWTSAPEEEPNPTEAV